jgi:hypothetical protein
MRLHRVRKVPKQPMYVLADLNTGVPRIVKTTGPTGRWGLSVMRGVKIVSGFLHFSYREL